ncbi:MAG: hypothetical protein CVV28_05855 [Methanobacteriales archaeon HGW-Methanobacteriales-1]|jgi:hypothetical protein|nr:MAG: hypothetical protein CVV28_05855 [Methanobacteriales archaeon HGW-Methanobacteriales-1]
MSDYSAGSAVFISIIIGFIISIFFDVIFAVATTGFIATYLTRAEERYTIIGAIAALILGVLVFFLNGIFLGPEMPYKISSLVSIDLGSFITGFIILCLLSFSLGALTGFIASKAAKNKAPG